MIKYTEQIKILCVDDERNVLRSLERVFLDDDYEIVLAGSGDEGLTMLESHGPFQVVISDYRMPVMNGVEFLKEVYKLEPDSVRLVLSGYADIGSIVAAINEGHIYKFIAKPWNDEELRETIHDCLERYFLRKKNRELLTELARANRELEDKVQQRTEQLELRNQALEFSQHLLGSLPVGVAGIDENGMIAYCNDMAAKYLKNVCGDIFGADLFASCSNDLGCLTQRVRREKIVSADISLGNSRFHVLGRTMVFRESESVILVFLEIYPNRNPVSCQTSSATPLPGGASSAGNLENDRKNHTNDITNQIEEVFSGVAGMDVSLGLRRVMGQESLYIAMLRRFVAGQKNSAGEIRRLLREGDPESAQRLAHNAKSISGTIGALRLQEQAAELEHAIRRRLSPDSIEPGLAVFETGLVELIAVIENCLPPETAPPSEDAGMDELFSVVGKLAALLADDSAEARDLFWKHSELLQRSLGDDYPSFQAAIDGFDFDAASALLERVRKKMTG